MTLTANRTVTSSWMLYALGVGPLFAISCWILWHVQRLGIEAPTLVGQLDSLRREFLIGAGVVTGVSLGASVFVSRYMQGAIASWKRSLHDCQEVMGQLKDGDLRVRMPERRDIQFIEYRVTVNQALHNLHRTICTTANTSEEVSRAAQLVREGSLAISQEATHQSCALEQIAVSLEQMTQMTSHTSNNSAITCDLANETYSSAQQGDVAMAKLVAAIDRIKKSADQQARIVRTIDEIAFQTNLLAVNAAIEAARAGEAGRGFAVVADEVRTLAQRCSEAAQLTVSMIEEVSKHTHDGVEITDEIGFVLSNIQERARRTNNCVASIANASREQALGIQQVSDAVVQLECVTQRLSANSRRSAEVADVMSRQVDVLNTVVGAYQLERENRAETIVATVSKTELSTPTYSAKVTTRRSTAQSTVSKSNSTTTTAGSMSKNADPLDQVFGTIDASLNPSFESFVKTDCDVAQSSIDAMLSGTGATTNGR